MLFKSLIGAALAGSALAAPTLQLSTNASQPTANSTGPYEPKVMIVSMVSRVQLLDETCEKLI